MKKNTGDNEVVTRKILNEVLDKRFSDFSIRLFDIFATKDDMRTQFKELEARLPTRDQVQKILDGNEILIKKLDKMEAEVAANTGNLQRLEGRVDAHDARFQVLEKRVATLENQA